METKICTHCHKEKIISNYYRDYSTVYTISYRAKCKECTNILSKQRKPNEKQNITDKICCCCRKELPILNYYKSTRHLDGYFSYCKFCHENKLKNVGFNEKIKRTPTYMQTYWKEKLKNVQYRMKQNIKRYISKRLINLKKTHKTTKYIGCSIDFFIKWIEFRFTKDMDWNNYSSYWELDHVLPCASFNLSDEENVLICFNWKNYQPLHKDENRKKTNSIIDMYIENQTHAIEKFLSCYEDKIEIVNNYYSLKVLLPVGESPTIGYTNERRELTGSP